MKSLTLQIYPPICYDECMADDYAIISFKTAREWRKWLQKHHADTQGVWMRLYKKASDTPSISMAEALDTALCYGWIDGQRKSSNAQSYLQKFTPRRKHSMWSKRNIEYVERLTQAGLMMPAGLAEVTRAKADGRWDAAYDKPSEMTIPDYFLQALHSHPRAEKMFENLNKTNRYAIVWRLQTAKTEPTRIRRQEKIITMLEAGEKLY